MPGKINEYVKRRADEEGLDSSEFLNEDEAFVEGKKKLNFDYQFSTGQTFKATESGGQAKFKILEGSKEVFDLADLAPKGLKFFTPTHWLGAGKFSGSTDAGFREIPEETRKSLQGKWQRGAGFVSVGSTASIKDIFNLLHELGHSDGGHDEVRNAEARGDWKRVAELISKAERDAWANALKMARKVKSDTGADLLEGFSGDDDVKRYIHTALSSHRFLSEFELSSIPTDFLKKLILGKYKIDPASKNYEWLDKLFDKRKLVKNEVAGDNPPVTLKDSEQASRASDAKELERARRELKNLMESDGGKK